MAGVTTTRLAQFVSKHNIFFSLRAQKIDLNGVVEDGLKKGNS